MSIRSVCLLVSLLCPIAASFAQLTRGYISGTVTDNTGAVVPGAAVRVINRATNIESQATTNALGFYRFAAVEPGTYAVEFSAPGFGSKRVENVPVTTGNEVTLNQDLEIANVETAIQVEEAAPGVELAKTSATVQRTMPTVVVENMPLTSGVRDINTLALLAPMASRIEEVSSGISVNGQRPRNNNFMIDGVDNNDLSITVQNSRIVPEAVKEYQIQTNPYSAEYGRSSGGQIIAATRSGGNEFHGNAYDYFRNNHLTANSWSNKAAGIKETPFFVHNQAGGSIGGPVLLPGYNGRNRTFFFQLVETNRYREAESPGTTANFNGTASVPTPEGLALLRTAPLAPGQTQESRNRILQDLEFLNQVYPRVPGQLDPVNTVRVNGVDIPVARINDPMSAPSNYWNVTTRVDHVLTSKDTLMYRLNYDKRSDPNVVSNSQFAHLFGGDQTVEGWNHAASWIRTFRGNLVNEFRYAKVTRDLAFPERSSEPTVNITGLFQIGGNTNFPQGRYQDVHQFQNVLTWIKGRHSIKLGGDVRVNLFDQTLENDVKGSWLFPNLQAFLNNQATRLTQALSTATYSLSQTQQFYFLQDDLRVTRDLTLNLGLRYEYNNIPEGFFGAINDQVANAMVPRPTQPDRNNWAPRGGFAWSPSNTSGLMQSLFGDGLTVFRGGYGIGYDVIYYNLAQFGAQNYPRVVVQTTEGAEVAGLYPTLAPKQPGVAPVFNPRAQFVNVATDAENPTTHFYSFSLQRQLGASYILELGYSGARSYHQIRQNAGNPAFLTEQQAATVRETGNPNSIPSVQARRLNPNVGNRVLMETTASSKYNAGYVKFDRRFANGLLVGANYTYSSLFSNNDEALAPAELATTPNIPQNWWDLQNEWSRSVFDRPHRFVTHWSYEVPWFRDGVLGHAALRAVLGGWRTTGFVELQSGIPFTVRTGVDTIGMGAGGSGASRPDWNPGGVLQKDPVEGNWRTFTTPKNNASVFITPRDSAGNPLGASDVNGGNLGRNTFRSTSFQNWNIGVSKMVAITERFSIQLRADAINAFNHRNFRVPSTNMNSALFGTQLADPGRRDVLLAAKVLF